jgi:hypothetical protein
VLTRCTLLTGALSAVIMLGAEANPRAASRPAARLVEKTFERKEASGPQTFTVRLRATRKVAPALLEALERDLTIHRAETGEGQRRAASKEELGFWRDRPLPLDPGRAEVQVELTPTGPGLDPHEWIYTWNDFFRIARPGVLEVSPNAAKAPSRSRARRDDDIGVVHQALHGAPHATVGTLLCGTTPVPFVKVVAAGRSSFSREDGTFTIDGELPGIPGTLFMAYDGQVPLVAGATSPTARLQIFDDFHFTRNDRVDRMPTVSGETASFGSVTMPGTDCVLWLQGIRVLRHYFGVAGVAPPAGQLRVKRWSAVFMSAGAAPHTFYDYIVAPTDLATRTGMARTFAHEFGHSVHHVADGSQSHWDWDNFRFIYGRVHDGGQVTNKGFVFNEGWSNYWSSVVVGGAVPVAGGAPGDPTFTDFNEDLVGQRLMTLSAPVGHAFMVDLLRNNPGVIHTLSQFEQRYCAAAPPGNPFCSGGRPVRALPSCPAGYNDDGLTCRLVNIVGKPSSGRGVGTVPSNCGSGREFDAGLCYPLCPSGFSGVGPVCWQRCPSDHHDDGAFCRRDAHIFGSNNDACPWYDKCGLTFAKGCSVCPAGYHNDGCTCRRDVHIIAKATRGRGVGTVPNGCSPGLQYDAGLCYAPCPAGFRGVGPVCWGGCPTGFADHGATCYRDPNVFSDDPVIAP